MKFTRVRNTLNAVGEGVQIAVAFAGVLMFLALVGVLLDALSPLLTAAFILLGTASGSLMHTRQTAMMSLGGFVIYLLAWPMFYQYGPVASMVLTPLGFALWFQAAVLGFFQPSLNQHRRVVA